jgi:hypothetical protein
MKVPEAKQYELVYDLDLAKLGRDQYTVNVATDPEAVRSDRLLSGVAVRGDTQLSMSRWMRHGRSGQDRCADGASRAHFLQDVANMNVWSNVESIKTGTGLKGGKH